MRKQKEQERKHREQNYLSEFDKVCSNLESLRRQAWIDFASLRLKENAELRLEMYHIAMEIEDAVLQAMEMRNILESKVALQRLKSRADNIKDDIKRAEGLEAKNRKNHDTALSSLSLLLLQYIIDLVL
jgi:hypothetical protein